MITKEIALEKLKQQLADIDNIKLKGLSSPEFKKWKRDTEVIIRKIFPDIDRHLDDFKSISYILMALNTTPAEDHKRFCDGLDEAGAVLRSFIDEVYEFWDDNQIPSPPNDIDAIKKLCTRFHLVTKQLRSRYSNRNTLYFVK